MEVPHDRAGWDYRANDGYLIDLLRGPLRDRPICITSFDTKDPSASDRQVFYRWADARYQPLPVGIILRNVTLTGSSSLANPLSDFQAR